MSLVFIDNNNKEFSKAMNNLVSDDSKNRENGLEEIKKIITSIKIKNFSEIFDKIWKNLYYFFWNCDKSSYQLTIAKKISNLIIIKENELIFNYEEFIKSFIKVFSNKFQSIDFLRLDKYIMLTDQIISFYFSVIQKTNNNNKIINFFKILIENKSNSVSFANAIYKVIGRFIKLNNENEIMKQFFEKFLDYFYLIKDKREINMINEEIIKNFNIEKFKDVFIKKSKEFLNKDLIKIKKDFIEILIKKLEDKNFVEERKIEELNKYILEKNYSTKLRKSKGEIKKEKIEKEKKEKEIKKKNKEIKMKKKEEIIKEIENEGVLKEIVKLDDKDNQIENKENKQENLNNNKEKNNEIKNNINNNKKKEIEKQKNEINKKTEKNKKSETNEKNINKNIQTKNEKSNKISFIKKNEDSSLSEDSYLLEDSSISDSNQSNTSNNNLEIDENDDDDDSSVSLNNNKSSSSSSIYNSINDEENDDEKIIENNNLLGKKHKNNFNINNNNFNNKKKQIKFNTNKDVIIYDKKEPIHLRSKKNDVFPKNIKKKSLLKNKK